MDSYGLTLVTAPAARPLSVEEARRWCRLSHQADDTDLAALIDAATRLAETEWSRQIVTATWRLTLPCFPRWEIRLPRNPLQAIQSIQYRSTAGTLTTLDEDLYEADVECDPGIVQPAYGRVWPATREMVQAVRVTFTAGYGTPAQVPETIKQALRFAVAWWSENRGDSKDTAALELPAVCSRLLASHWNGSYA